MAVQSTSAKYWCHRTVSRRNWAKKCGRRGKQMEHWGERERTIWCCTKQQLPDSQCDCSRQWEWGYSWPHARPEREPNRTCQQLQSAVAPMRAPATMPLLRARSKVLALAPEKAPLGIRAGGGAQGVLPPPPCHSLAREAVLSWYRYTRELILLLSYTQLVALTSLLHMCTHRYSLLPTTFANN